MHTHKKDIRDQLLKTQNIDHLLRTQNIGRHKIKVDLKGSTMRWATFRKWLGQSSVALAVFSLAFMATQYVLQSRSTSPEFRALLQQCQIHLAHKEIQAAEQCYHKILKLDERNLLAANGLKQVALLQAEKTPPTSSQPTPSAHHQPSTPPVVEVDPPPVHLTAQTSPAPLEKPATPVSQNQPDEATTPDPTLTKKPAKTEEEDPLVADEQIHLEEHKVTIAALLQQCETHFQAKRLTSGSKGTAFECYQAVLARAPDNTEAQKGLEKIDSLYQAWAEKALDRGKLRQVRLYLDKIRLVNPHSVAFTKIDNYYQQHIEKALNANQKTLARRYLFDLEKLNPESSLLAQLKPILVEGEQSAAASSLTQQLQQCEQHLQANRLTSGRGGTAFDCYQQVLKTEPNNLAARRGLKAIEARYQAWAESALNRGQLQKARRFLNSLAKVNPKSPVLSRLQQRILELEKSASRSRAPPSPAPKPSETSTQRALSLPTSQTSQCGEIFTQESLGIQPLTQAQKVFKKQHCNPTP